MNRFSTLMCVVAATLLAAGAAFAQAPGAAAFSGFWAFDDAKTSKSKDFPEKLKDFKMLVSSDQERLMVKAQVVPFIEPRAVGGQSSQVGISSSTASRTSVASPNGNGVSASSADGGLANASVNYGGTLALYFTAPEITYDLTGKEIKIEPNAGDKVNGTTRIKAKMGKDGKSVELTAIRRLKGPRGETEVTTRETWKLGDDGSTMKFHRTVESPTYRDEISMILDKKQ